MLDGGQRSSGLLDGDVCGDRGLEHMFDRDVVSDGGGPAVFELWRGVDGFAVERADLDADVAEGCGDGDVVAIEADAALLVDADAEGGGFTQEEALESGAVVLVGEDGEERAGPTLLHADGSGHDIKGAECERLLGDVGEDLGVEVVERGFKDGDEAGVRGVPVRGLAEGDGQIVCVTGVRRRVCAGVGLPAGSDGRGEGADLRGGDGLAEREAEDVGEACGIACAGAVADAAGAHGRLRAEAGCESADEGGASGGDELFLEVCGVGGEAAEEIRGCGRGDGEVAVGALDHAAADVEWRAVPVERLAGVRECLLVEVLDASACADDIDDGVDRANFVEVDLFERDVVDFGFGRAEQLEGGDGEVLHGLGEVGVVDELADDGEGAAVGVLVLLLVSLLYRACVRADGRGYDRSCGGVGSRGGDGGRSCAALVAQAAATAAARSRRARRLSRLSSRRLPCACAGVLRRVGRLRGRGPWWL